MTSPPSGREWGCSVDKVDKTESGERKEGTRNIDFLHNQLGKVLCFYDFCQAKQEYASPPSALQGDLPNNDSLLEGLEDHS